MGTEVRSGEGSVALVTSGAVAKDPTHACCVREPAVGGSADASMLAEKRVGASWMRLWRGTGGLGWFVGLNGRSVCGAWAPFAIPNALKTGVSDEIQRCQVV